MAIGTTCQISSITQQKGVGYLKKARNRVWKKTKFSLSGSFTSVCVCVWAKSHTPLGLSFPNGHLEDFVIERSIIAFCPTVLRKDPKPCFFIYEHSPQVNVTRRHGTSGCMG